jgi:hypothetical protein
VVSKRVTLSTREAASCVVVCLGSRGFSPHQSLPFGEPTVRLFSRVGGTVSLVPPLESRCPRSLRVDHLLVKIYLAHQFGGRGVLLRHDGLHVLQDTRRVPFEPILHGVGRNPKFLCKLLVGTVVFLDVVFQVFHVSIFRSPMLPTKYEWSCAA